MGFWELYTLVDTKICFNIRWFDSFDFMCWCLLMCSREHSVILLVNVKEHIVGDVKLDENTKNSDMLDFSLGCRGASRMPHRCLLIMSHYKAMFVVPDVHNQAQCWKFAGSDKIVSKSG